MSKAPFRLLYNNDSTNTAGVVSPWHEEESPFAESMLVASIREVAEKGVDAYFLSPGMGWVPWWKSDVEPGFYDWWEARTGLKVTNVPDRGYDAYVRNGGDMVQVLVDTCRKYGMAPFVSLRLNDVHHQENYARKNEKSLVSCRFYTEHPEWHVDPDHPQKEGYYKKRGMDWAVKEVRDYKLSLLRELADKYDLAGLELDFLRDDTLFGDNGPPETERIELITGFVESVRSALDRKRGKRRWVCVRVPLEQSAHPRIGLDVRRLRDVGVDMFNLSGWYHTTQRTDLATVRALVPDAAIYLEMTHSTGWHPYFLQSGLYGTDGDPRTSDHQFFTTAFLAHRRGADGISLFNFVYYRMGHKRDIPVMEPPFHILPFLNDTEYLSRQNRYFMIAGTSYHGQLPAETAVGNPTRLLLDMVPPVTEQHADPGRPPPCRLRLHTKQALTSDHALTVRFNGRMLDLCPDTSRFFGNPFDPMISPLENRRAWLLPTALIQDGQNMVDVELKTGQNVCLVYVDAGVPRHAG